MEKFPSRSAGRSRKPCANCFGFSGTAQLRLDSDPRSWLATSFAVLLAAPINLMHYFGYPGRPGGSLTSKGPSSST